MKIPQQPWQQNAFKYGITFLIVVSSIWSASGLEITLERIIDAPRQIGILVGAMFPLDLSDEALDRIIPKVWESLFIAWAGTVIGALFSFPISFLAANNTSTAFISRITKQILNAIRAFPELILAFVFLPITGLGPLTGTLAVGIHSIGTLGKLSSEVIEGIDAIPSSVAESEDINTAWEKAFNADSLSAFGGVVIFNNTVDEKLALKLNKIFLELIVAPDFTKKALILFSKKPNLRIIKIKNIKKLLNNHKKEISLLPESILVQDVDNSIITKKKLKVVSIKKPTKKELDDLVFAFKVVKYVRSNAIVIAKNKTTIVIAHRLSTILNSSNIYVIDSGKAIDNGKHEDLIVKSELYKNFYEKQIQK